MRERKTLVLFKVKEKKFLVVNPLKLLTFALKYELFASANQDVADYQSSLV